MKKIFLIDDDPVFVFLAHKMIATLDSSVEVNIFSDGEMATEALGGLFEKPGRLPDVIFLDLNMPVMDGWQFLDWYAGAWAGGFGKSIALYIVSSTISPEDVERATRYAFVAGVMIKPVVKEWMEKVLATASH
jgi:CheY-like chemotaxis protein